MEEFVYKTTKPLIPRFVDIWKFPGGYKTEVETKEGGSLDFSYEYEIKIIKPATDELPEKETIPLNEIRKFLLNTIRGLNEEELFDFDKDWSANNKFLCEQFGFLKIGKIMDLSEQEGFYQRLGLMKDTAGGIASIDIKKIWQAARVKQVKIYHEDSNLWIQLLREIYYIEKISGRKDINEEKLEKIMKIYSPLVQAMLNEDLKEISPRIKWDNGSLYFQSSTLMGNILLYCLDNLHTRIQRCLGCGKFITAERSTKKFCIKSGSCQKKYSRIRKEAENKGLESFILNGITFHTKSGKPI